MGNLKQNSTSTVLMVEPDTAKDALTDTQKRDISGFATIVHADVRTIEAAGGGSVRCMLAEIYK